MRIAIRRPVVRAQSVHTTSGYTISAYLPEFMVVYNNYLI